VPTESVTVLLIDKQPFGLALPNIAIMLWKFSISNGTKKQVSQTLQLHKTSVIMHKKLLAVHNIGKEYQFLTWDAIVRGLLEFNNISSKVETNIYFGRLYISFWFHGVELVLILIWIGWKPTLIKVAQYNEPIENEEYFAPYRLHALYKFLILSFR
jgi:hypothetical protein